MMGGGWREKKTKGKRKKVKGKRKKRLCFLLLLPFTFFLLPLIFFSRHPL
jgi:hypothetical protein